MRTPLVFNDNGAANCLVGLRAAPWSVWPPPRCTPPLLRAGRGITNSGMGAKVEGFKNYAKYGAVYGGSEEIMADLAIRQALRNFPQNAKL